MEHTRIAIRGYVMPEEATNYEKPDQIKIVNQTRSLVLDNETTVDQYQNLTFGRYAIYQHSTKIDEGIYYNPRLVTKNDLAILKKYSNKVIPVQEFVDRIFYPEVYEMQTLCVGFNLPFDLSRLAIGFGYGRKANRDAFSLELTKNKKYPRIIIRHLDSTKSFIRFGTSGLTKYQYAGNFLDLRTLSFALSGIKHTLESACKFFGSEIKKRPTDKHGKITIKYVEYNKNDVDATYNLYQTLKQEYEKYNLSKPITKIFSPASIGKALLDEIRVLPFDQISNVSLETMGLLMTTYIGARSEVRLRHIDVLVKYLDFLSMYPTVCILLNLWPFVIAEQIYEEECTELAQEFVNKITLDELNDPKTWKDLVVIVCIKPEGDILPIRAHYGNEYAYNIGLNHAQYDGKLWFCLADVISSKLLGDRTPKILKAIRFVPKGIQENLKKIKLLDEQVDPKNDIFKKVVEKRQELKDADDAREHILKIIANSTSYGIYAQINTESRKGLVDVYGLTHYESIVQKIEKIGERFNPILATFITSGSRLILAIVEAILAKNQKTYAFCDTDSMAIPADMVDTIQSYFQKLNPYNFDKPLFKLEDENFDECKNPQDLWFFGISSKRYVLYNIVDGKIIIRKHSSHGLGHIENPFSSDIDWEREFWTDILEYHHGKTSVDNINEKYSGYYAISEMSASTPFLHHRFRNLNAGKELQQQIKPFNFFLVGFGSRSARPLCVYRKNAQQVVYGEFIDYETGKIRSGLQYWKEMSQIFWDYLNHKDGKFDGEIRVLQRKHLTISGIDVIGKESNELEESEVLGLDEKSYVKYASQIDIRKILQMTPKEAKKAGISKIQLNRMKKAIRNGKFNPRRKTIKKLTYTS